MQRKGEIVQELSVDEQTFERTESRTEPVEDGPELRPSVEQETQGKVDTNHPDAMPDSLTQIDEERLRAREREIARTRERTDRRQDSDREARTRRSAQAGSRARRQAIDERACRGSPPWDCRGVDPREQLSQDELARVNQAAARIAADVDTSPATVSRLLAKRVADGTALAEAVLAVHERVRTAQLHVPIELVAEVPRREVNITGTLSELWSPSSLRIQQVGLLKDESGQIKVTSFKRSHQPWIEEGERVKIYNAAKNWYQGRASVALTSWSEVHFPERGDWWK